MGEMGTVGDCWDRYMVRVREIEQSCRIIRQALDTLPDGAVPGHRAEEARQGARRRGLHARRERQGRAGPLHHRRRRARPPSATRCARPSFCNLQVVEKVGVGQMVSDLVALVGSLDIVLGEIDR